jgi:hypothetical protein
MGCVPVGRVPLTVPAGPRSRKLVMIQEAGCMMSLTAVQVAVDVGSFGISLLVRCGLEVIPSLRATACNISMELDERKMIENDVHHSNKAFDMSCDLTARFFNSNMDVEEVLIKVGAEQNLLHNSACCRTILGKHEMNLVESDGCTGAIYVQTWDTPAMYDVANTVL